jgi:hypothetical protein
MLFASLSKWDDGAARGRLGFEGRSQASAQTAAVQLAEASCALLRMDVRPSKSTAQKKPPTCKAIPCERLSSLRNAFRTRLTMD